MNAAVAPAAILVLTCGNPSRGDDALGSALYELLKDYQQTTGKLADVELLTDFQLQIEHALDLENRHHVIFVDASVSCPAPFEYRKLTAERDESFTTHAMSPASVLAVYEQVNQREPPPAYLLTIRGYEFDLGLEICLKAQANLQLAYKFILAILAQAIVPREIFLKS